MPTIQVRNSPRFGLEDVSSGKSVLSGSLFVPGFSSAPSDIWGFTDATLGELTLLEITLLSFGVLSSSRSCFLPSGLAVASGTTL